MKQIDWMALYRTCTSTLQKLPHALRSALQRIFSRKPAPIQPKENTPKPPRFRALPALRCLALYRAFTLQELRHGLMVTLKRMFSRKLTLMYPEEKTPKSPRFRGLPALRRYPNGEERCIACKLCEAVCPALAITIDSEPREDGTRRTKLYEIDLFKCIYCGFCEESCPVDSIVLTDIHEFHMEQNHQRVISKPDLLALGEQYEAQIAEARRRDSAYR